jgi:hypothetical protein
MNILLADTQTVGELEDTIFEMTQNSPVSALVTLANRGTANTMNYRFQQLVAGIWLDLASLGDLDNLNGTLSPGQVKAVLVASAYPQVQLVGNASGGTELEFGVTRYYPRADGAPLPILSL